MRRSFPLMRTRGVPDIRDKELRAKFNRVLDRGGDLTLFFDSCESGSVARGLRRQGRATKGIGPSAAGVSDPTPEGPAPADRGALVIMSTEEGGQAKDGVFTAAFLDALRMHRSDEPAESIVRRSIPLMRGIDPTTRQQPRVEGGGDGLPFLGTAASAAGADAPFVVVNHVDTAAARVVLDGGHALGLTVGTKLACESEARIRIMEVGLVRSEAQVQDGTDRAPSPGEVCRVDEWVIHSALGLRVWLARESPQDNDLAAAIHSVKAARNQRPQSFVGDPTESSPTHELLWESGQWVLRGTDDVPLGTAFSESQLQGALSEIIQSTRAPVRVFFNVPLPRDVLAPLSGAEMFRKGSVIGARTPGEAQYHLVGRLPDGPDGIDPQHVDYAWVHPNAIGTEWDSTMPVRSEWISIESSEPIATASSVLEDLALRASLVRGWLTLSSPPPARRDELGEGREPFDYGLVFYDVDADRVVPPGGVLVQGHPYKLALHYHGSQPLRPRRNMEQRFVYVFAIDRNGRGSLLFPIADQSGSLHARYPKSWSDYPDQTLPQRIDLWARAKQMVGKPYGTETVILVTTRESLGPGNPKRLFEFKGVRDRNSTNGNPLTELFNNVAVRAGSASFDLGKWSVERFLFRTAGSLPE